MKRKNFRLENKGPANEQEAFDAVVFHALQQAEPCIDSYEDGCVLRYPAAANAPLACFVGALIPDSKWPQDNNTGDITDEVCDFLINLSPSFLYNIRWSHDHAASKRDDWLSHTLGQLTQTAETHDLVFPNIEAMALDTYKEY